MFSRLFRKKQIPIRNRSWSKFWYRYPPLKLTYPVAPENGWLEDFLVSFRECSFFLFFMDVRWHTQSTSKHSEDFTKKIETVQLSFSPPKGPKFVGDVGGWYHSRVLKINNQRRTWTTLACHYAYRNISDAFFKHDPNNCRAQSMIFIYSLVIQIQISNLHKKFHTWIHVWWKFVVRLLLEHHPSFGGNPRFLKWGAPFSLICRTSQGESRVWWGDVEPIKSTSTHGTGFSDNHLKQP